jgi:phage terminase large subunit-like protein
VFDQAMFGLRSGAQPRWIATTTPRPIALIRRLINQPGVIVTRGRSDENLRNLAASFRDNVIARYRGTRLGRQELDAEILEDVPGALWTRRVIDETRVNVAPDLQRIVVGVDPAASSGENANETGIVVMGLAGTGHAYVLEDWSLRASPDGWARKAAGAYRKWSADCLVAEANQGGEMVERVIRSVADIPVKLVRATRGKYVRAEPISALYEQGRVHHVGVFAALEDQMVAFTPSELSADGSPDRMDALVWAATELFPDIVAPAMAPRVSARQTLFGSSGWMR